MLVVPHCGWVHRCRCRLVKANCRSPPCRAGSQTPPPSRPLQARSSHSITAVGDRLYLWGGESAPRVPISTDMHAYDMQAAQWSLVQVRPCGAAAACINGGLHLRQAMRWPWWFRL